MRRFDQGPIPEVRIVITRRNRIDVDLRFSLLEIKRANQVDVRPLLANQSVVHFSPRLAVADYLGHRDPKHIVHSIRVAAGRFEGLWR